MPSLQIAISEAEREFLARLLAENLKAKRVEVHRTEFSREYREHVEAEEALLQSLCDKVSHAVATL